MRRELEEVLASQKKMLERRGEPNETPDDKMIDIYKDHLWKVGYLMKHKDHLQVLELPYRDVLDDARTQAQRIAEFLDQPLDVDKMASMVDRQLYRNRKEDLPSAS